MYTAEGCLHYRCRDSFLKVYGYLREQALVDRCGYFLNPTYRYRISETKDISKKNRIIRLPKHLYQTLQPQFLVQVPKIDGWLYWINHNDGDKISAYINGWRFEAIPHILQELIAKTAPFIGEKLASDFTGNISVVIKGLYLSEISGHENQNRKGIYDKLMQTIKFNCYKIDSGQSEEVEDV